MKSLPPWCSLFGKVWTLQLHSGAHQKWTKQAYQDLLKEAVLVHKLWSSLFVLRMWSDFNQTQPLEELHFFGVNQLLQSFTGHCRMRNGIEFSRMLILTNWRAVWEIRSNEHLASEQCECSHLSCVTVVYLHMFLKHMFTPAKINERVNNNSLLLVYEDGHCQWHTG